MDPAMKRYFEKVDQQFRLGNATEHTYRATLQALVEALQPGVTATNEPKRIACGAPDYIVTRQEGHGPLTIGYIEAKDIAEPLDVIEKTDQLKRYFSNLHNLIVTDYVEFRWYIGGQERQRARLATVAGKGALRFDPAGAEQVAALLGGFLGHGFDPINQPRALAERMARLAHMIKDIAFAAFARGEASETMRDLLAAFQTVLIPDLAPPAFTDMFAQTLAYGLFAARQNHTKPTPFTRRDAASEIPKTNPFLRKLFTTITGPDLDDEPFAGFVEDLTRLLAQTDMAAVLQDFGKRAKLEDPIVHFYETFLTAYDPKLRELRGVYYTPEPVVSYIVRSVDAVLRTRFDCPDGLAQRDTTRSVVTDGAGTRTEESPRVLILDPACGTGTFLYHVVDHIRATYQRGGNAGMWSGYVARHLLPRVFGFELLMAPYAMAHLKLGMQLAALDLAGAERERWAYHFESSERLGVFLTNTLEEAAVRSERLALAGFISDEANAAGGLKKTRPVMVVLGNPPYSGHSANKGEWITRLLRGEEILQGQGKDAIVAPTASYFHVDGQPLGERNPKWLNDDYVKFLRFAQWRIERTGHGVLAFITNHGYLDNPTFRGMRQALIGAFDEIFALNLHGNSKKKERVPGGGKDENVFDIQQGVAIGIFIRRPGTHQRHAVVKHADLWGDRAGKYAWLADRDLTTTEWREVTPQGRYYFFTPRNMDLAAEFERGWELGRAMPINVLGFQTHRDPFAIAFDEATITARMSAMRDTRVSDQAFAEQYDLTDNRDWQLVNARTALRKDAAWQTHTIRCLYRPFDWRYCYFNEIAMDYPRRELKQHMLHPNVSINVPRQTKAGFWQHSVVAHSPTPALLTEIKDGSSVFPLYLYPNGHELPGMEGYAAGPGGRRPNLAAAFIADLEAKTGLRFIPDGTGDLAATVGPEDVFHYLYAVFHAPEYRARYGEFLKSDFPRLPLTSDRALFRDLCGLGARLVALHLMEATGGAPASFPEPGANVVARVEYTPPLADGTRGRVWINKTQYFDGVAPEVWEFHVGGYQVCQKWLKDRKGRLLDYDDLDHYGRVVAALGETIQVMERIDEIIEERGGWPLQ